MRWYPMKSREEVLEFSSENLENLAQFRTRLLAHRAVSQGSQSDLNAFSEHLFKKNLPRIRQLQAVGHDPETGAELWRADGLNPENNGAYRIVASPVVMDGVIYAPTRERPLLALRAGGRGDITASHLIWTTQNGPDVPTPVTDGTYFYIVNDRGIVFCLDAKTGETIYGPQRITPGTYSSSPVLADDKIYVTNEDGTTTVYSAGPEFRILAENVMDEYTLSSVAISEGQLFLRTDSFLYAVGERREN